jgi:hypothetical protein
MKLRAGICGDWGGPGRTARRDQAGGAHLFGPVGTARPMPAVYQLALVR